MRSKVIASRLLIGVIAAGTALQCYVMFFLMNPRQLFWWDARRYYSIAQALAQGQPYSTALNPENLYQSPGYPFILSLFIRLVGSDLVWLLLIHVAIFPLFLYSLYHLGAEWKGRRTGVIAAALAIFYPLYIYQPLTMYPESLLMYMFPAMVLLALWLRKKTLFRYAVVLSLLLAIAVLIRPTAVCVIPPLLFLVKRGNPLAVKKFAAVTAIIVTIPCIAVTSWMVRNELVHGQWIFSTAGSENLLMSYNENASWQTKRTALPSEIQSKLMNAGNMLEHSRIASEEAAKFIRTHPVQSFEIAVMRCLDLWNPIPHTTIENGFAQMKYKFITAGVYLVMLALGAGGMYMCRRDAFVQALLMLMILNTVCNGVVAVSVRYRLVTDFAFLLPAAWLIEGLTCRTSKSKIVKSN